MTNPNDCVFSKKKIINGKDEGRYKLMLVRVSDDECWTVDIKRELTVQEINELTGLSYDTVKKRRQRGHDWMKSLNPAMRDTFYRNYQT